MLGKINSVRRLRIESLETRTLLSLTLPVERDIVAAGIQLAPTAASNFSEASPLAQSYIAPVGFTPQQIRMAYGINSISLGSLVGDGAGQTIAIVVPYNNPKFVSTTDANYLTSDLHLFNVAFGLSDPPSFSKLDQNGGTNYPGIGPAGPGAERSWAQETALDVEWTHAVAPQANIILVEANSPGLADIYTAIDTARNLPDVSVVVMSFGWTESQLDANAVQLMDSILTTPAGHQGVTFVAASGDDGSPGTYPAYSPTVLAVGGTYLDPLTANDVYVSETGWNSSGGGQSTFETEPSYQQAVQQSGHRQIPDVAFDADPNSGVAVYDSYDYGSETPWAMVGGTSLGAPCWGSLIAIANQLRASQSLGTLDGATQTLPGLYNLPPVDFHDVTGGNNGDFSAFLGYDQVTGMGTPVANTLVSDLAALKQALPPVVKSTTPSITGGTINTFDTQLSIDFGQPIFGLNAAANFELHGMGDDGLLGTVDDTIIPLTLTTTNNTVTLYFPQLAEGVYRLVIYDAITDTRGRKLDGNGDQVAGGNYSTDFVVINSTLLSSVTSFPSGNTTFEGANDVAVADVNGDGKMDAILVNAGNYDAQIRVLFGDGAGGFGAPIPINTGAINAVGVITSDFNGDGKIDLAVCGGADDEVAILLNDGSGAFASPTYFYAGGHVQGVDGGAYDLAAADFDGDGKTDLAVVNNGYYGQLSILTGDGTGAFSSPQVEQIGVSNPSVVLAGDFNGDGRAYVIVMSAKFYGEISVLSGDVAGGTGQSTIDYPGYLSPQDMAVGDFNVDGKMDLAVLNANGGIGIFLGDANGGFGSAAFFGEGGFRADHLVVGDFNGDGKTDLAITAGGKAAIGIFLGDGQGGFARENDYTTGTGSICLATGDFNGDGKTDVLETPAYDNHDGTMGVLLNDYHPPVTALYSTRPLIFSVATGAFGTGQLIQGTGNAFDGYGRLSINGVLFQPNTLSFNRTDNGQNLVTGEGTFSGLTVSRKITVPNSGNEDFARTIDTFFNPTGDAITATVKIVGNLGSDAATTVFATSDGDNIVEPSDRWIGTDGNGTPALIHYIHGHGGLQPLAAEVIGDNIQWIYEITVPAGQSVQLAYLTIAGATRSEAVAAAETLVGTSDFGGQAGEFLSSAEKAALGNFQFPALPQISINDVTVTEGDDGTQTFVFTVSLSNAYDEDVSVNYATADGTATAGSDYSAASGTLTWTAGDSKSQYIVVHMNGDTALESDETFFVNLTDPTFATLSNSQSVGTIQNDDVNQKPTVTVVTPTSPQSGDVTINYTLFDNESDPCSIQVEVSYFGGNWETVPTEAGDGTTGLASSPSGVEHMFVWKNNLSWPDILVEGVPAYKSTGLRFRITPSDAEGVGSPAATDTVTVVDALDTTPPTPNPSTWATPPHATGTTSISMTATTATDINLVEYFFHSLTPGGHDSGWQTSSTYEDVGLSPNTLYMYKVQTRDKFFTPNEGAFSAMAAATTNQEIPPLPIVKGTSGNDVFEFFAGSSPSTWIFKLNGVKQAIPVTDKGIMIDGLSGNDTLWFYGASGAVTADISYAQGTFQFAGFTVGYENLDNVTVSGASGNDIATLHDSAGDDTFEGLSGTAQLTTPGKTLTVKNFKSVTVQASEGNDSAVMYDSQTGNSNYVAGPAGVHYVGVGFNYTIAGFKAVSAYARPGTNNTAVFNSTNGHDLLIASYLGAQFIGQGFAYDVWNLTSIEGNAGSNDEARFYGSPGGNTSLNASPDNVTQIETNLTIKGTGFGLFSSYVYPNGNTSASLVGSTDGARAVTSPLGAQLFGGSYELSAWTYRHITVVGLGDDDTADMYVSSGADALEAHSAMTTLTSGGVDRTVNAFGKVRAHGNAASSATFFAAQGLTNTFDVSPTEAVMSGANYKNVATYFGSNTGYGVVGGTDVVNYTDSAGTDNFISSYLGTQMFGQGYSNAGWNFAEMNAISTGGPDTARFYGSPNNPDSFVGTPTDAKHSGTGYKSEAKNFARVEAYSGLGSGGTAQLTGTSGDDRYVGSPLGAQLWNQNYRVEAWNYASVKAEGNGGNDRANLYGSAKNNNLAADNVFAEFSGEGFANRVDHFATTAVHGSINSSDIAALDHAYLETGVKDTPDNDQGHTITRKLWLYDFNQISTTENPAHPTPQPQPVDKLMTAFMWEN
jgi:hypothetical protein